MKGKILFDETQSFRGTWTWYLLIVVEALAIGGTGFAIVTQPFTNESLVAIIITIGVLGGIMLLFSFSKLRMQIDQDAIYYSFPPFVNSEKVLRKGDVQEVYVRQYKAIWEYGGYGYRFRFKSGRAMNIAGNVGLQLVFKNGKRLLIGTQKRDALESAVRKLKENWEMNG